MVAEETRRIITVSQLNEYIKAVIEGQPVLRSLFVKGEISNFTNHYKTGHFYFTLKDENSLIRCIMFKGFAEKLKFVPENGMKIILHGKVSAYPKDGQYQLYADNMEPDGIGALYIAYEQLKAKLEKEGLFNPIHKKPLPKIPKRVGIITSPTGAAIRDIINILGRRFPYAEGVLYPALVQGDGAPAQLIAGMKYFNSANNVDVIIIGRGGGSIEDLWAFNDEGLAREVFASKIPVISAVGHETDFTICDFVADRRAPTPSAAAELAVPETMELKQKILNIIGRMDMLIMHNIENNRQRLNELSGKRVLNTPDYIVDDRRFQLMNLDARMENGMKYSLSLKKELFARYTSKLEALNPMSVISRGYSAVFTDEGRLIKSVDQVEVGDRLNFKTVDGTVSAEVKGKIKNG
ncbi:MAG: exodeoxyribonuclease VII large subunit [Clostridia bacterium]|nr:exodeoxyribonuclease VII large subunit [Clostridia bacterium]